ncbi:hypothetical protein Cpir12675_000911 [Ceratocystis pirilliformis]|uniref:Carboxylesterase type B domain-containing protein n=1 Tax=Ceratocystis pirilliformis TaxID=259994 RepID=A0ABR3ZJ65_9PEZI
MAGSTIEKEGLPNAGMWDQRAVFQWVQDYIYLVGGDPNSVTAMGESASAGSIEHHLIARGGTLNPLFHRAILMSPAFQPMWDRHGSMEDIYKKFERLAGCEGQGLACLRRRSSQDLIEANTELLQTHHPGSFALGPSPDGSYIRQLPALEIALGRFWPIESIITTHTSEESILFVSGQVRTNDEFVEFLPGIFPDYTINAGVVDAITEFYPPVTRSKNSVYRSQSERIGALIRDSCIVCNVRFLNEGVGDRNTYNLQYSVFPGWHGMDLFALFFHPKFSGNSWMQLLAAVFLFPVGLMFSGISKALQSYYTSYIITGDPNARRARWNVPPTVEWQHPRSVGREHISNVVNIGNLHISTVTDTEVSLEACDFWREIFAAATALGGYSPKNEVVFPSLFNVTMDPSRRFGNLSIEKDWQD